MKRRLKNDTHYLLHSIQMYQKESQYSYAVRETRLLSPSVLIRSPSISHLSLPFPLQSVSSC